MSSFGYSDQWQSSTREDDTPVETATAEQDEAQESPDTPETTTDAQDAQGSAEERKSKPKTPARKAKKSADEVDRALVRRTANKVEAVSAADEQEVGLLGVVYGVQPTAVDVTVAIMTGEKKDLAPLDDVMRVAEAEVALRAVEAMSLGREGLNGVWKVLVFFDLVPARFPADDLSATKKMIVALDDLTDDHRMTVMSAADLAKKH